MKASTTQPFVAPTFRFGSIEVRPDERQLLVDGASARLGARAFDVLLALVERRERVVGKNELLELVWPGLVVEENNLQVHISALRKILGPQVIATVPGRGYRFTQSPDPSADRETPVPARAAPAAARATVAGIPAEASLFGRDDDSSALRRLLDAHRLVTIAGPGGIGKTALARTLAHVALPAFDDGVCVVELAAVNDASLVATAVAGALGAKLGNQLPMDAIRLALDGRRKLLVLDNCEHLLDAVARLVDALLPVAPDVHWLATSQEPLKLAAEHVYRLGALAFPADETVEVARQSGAVALFEARADAAGPRFALDAANVAAVIDICRHLDGIPLAIELAAARVPMLGVEGLRRRLDERLRVLTGGARLALPRHQTLRAALEWSHSLLTPEQQVVFRRLGVFAGSFSLDAAQQVAADEAIDAWSVLDELGALIDKSLVVVLPDASGESRYRLLETMRHYALDRLAAAGDGDATRTHHLDVFVALADHAGIALRGPQQAAWTARLDLDHENLLAAHAWCRHVASGGERALKLVTGLNRYWSNRELFALSYRVTSEALQCAGSERRDKLRCGALVQAARMASRIGLRERARLALDEAAAIARELGDRRVLANALAASGIEFNKNGDRCAARAALEESMTLARDSAGDGALVAAVATALAELERTEGDLQAAQPLYEEALANARLRGDLRSICTNATNLAMIAIVQGRADGTHALVAETMIAGSDLKTGLGQMFTLLLCAGLAGLQGEWPASARFHGAAMHHFGRFEWRLDPPDQAFADSVRDRARSALGDRAFEAAQAAGRDRAFDQTLVELTRWLRDHR